MPRSSGDRGLGHLVTSLRAAFLVVAIAVIIPFVLLVGYLAYGQVRSEKRRGQEEALSQARILAAQIERHLTARIDGVAAAAAVVAASGNDAAVIEAQARRVRQSFPDIDGLSVVDELGLGVAPTREGRRPALGDQAWFTRAATATEPFLGGAARVGPDVLVSFYAPARAPEGQFRGAIAADLSLRRVQEMLTQARLGQGAVAEVLTDKGLVLAREPALFLMRNVLELPGYAELLLAKGGAGELAFEDDESRLMGAVAIRPLGWLLAIGLPSAQVLAETRSRIGRVGAATVVVALVGLGAALILARSNVAGMRRLRAAMSRLETGDLPASVPVTVGGDVGALTEGFNRMLGWLRGKLLDYQALSQVEEVAGEAIGSEGSVDLVLAGLLRKVVAGMGADAGVMLLRDETGLVARAAVGLSGIPTEGMKLRRGQGLAGVALTDRGTIAIPDTDADHRIDEPYIKAAGLRSVVAVPILSADEVVGVVEVGYRAPHIFPDGEIQRLEAMVRRTAQALGHASALDVVRRNTAGLEVQVAEQMEALQRAAVEQAEARRQTQEARRQTQELEQKIKAQVAQVREVIVEREVVRVDPTSEESAGLRAAMQRTVSEELRAPLSALLDLPRFLVEGLQKPLGDDERRQLEILQERGQEILELIENLVILSGLDAGQIRIVKAPFDLPQLIHRVVRALQPRAAAKGNRIEADIKLNVGPLVSDARRVEQVLANLLVTATKYTEVGEIRVTAYLRDTEVVLTVGDDGAGFTAEEQARIFEPFLQVGPRNGRALPGTGLLLTVCERLVLVLGGRIRCDSEVDRGTWFTISLPVQP